MVSVKQIALDSAILPLALYFEPEEIAAACLGLGSIVFKQTFPRFQQPQLTQMAVMSTRLKEINSHSSNNQGQKLTGEQVLSKYFPATPWINLDLTKNYYKLTDQDELKKAQPYWFKFLSVKTNKNDPEGIISMHQVDFLVTLILKV